MCTIFIFFVLYNTLLGYRLRYLNHRSLVPGSPWSMVPSSETAVLSKSENSNPTTAIYNVPNTRVPGQTEATKQKPEQARSYRPAPCTYLGTQPTIANNQYITDKDTRLLCFCQNAKQGSRQDFLWEKKSFIVSIDYTRVDLDYSSYSIQMALFRTGATAPSCATSTSNAAHCSATANGYQCLWFVS